MDGYFKHLSNNNQHTICTMDSDSMKLNVNSFYDKGQAHESTIDDSSVLENDSSLAHDKRDEIKQIKGQTIQMNNLIVKLNQNDSDASEKPNIEKIFIQGVRNIEIQYSFQDRIQNVLQRLKRLTSSSQKIKKSNMEDLTAKGLNIYQKKLKQQHQLKTIIENKQKTLRQKQQRRKEKIYTQHKHKHVSYVSSKKCQNIIKDSHTNQFKNEIENGKVNQQPTVDTKNYESPIAKIEFQRNQKVKTAFTLDVRTQGFSIQHIEQDSNVKSSKNIEKRQIENNSEVQRVLMRSMTVEVSAQIKEEMTSIASQRRGQIEKMSAEQKEIKYKQENKNNLLKAKLGRKKK